MAGELLELNDPPHEANQISVRSTRKLQRAVDKLASSHSDLLEAVVSQSNRVTLLERKVDRALEKTRPVGERQGGQDFRLWGDVKRRLHRQEARSAHAAPDIREDVSFADRSTPHGLPPSTMFVSGHQAPLQDGPDHGSGAAVK